EGATKFIEYRVRGARSKKDARTIARTISDSTLVKAAMFGRDPNWGRVLCAAGNADVDLDPSKVDLFMGDTSRQMQVLDRGAPVDLDRNALKKLLRNSHIQIDLDLHEGRATAVAWGADLSTDYVLFNSVYTT
ncbi:MAG: bifunctional ornithine acetyltransferase/N-acetylglutamate synthase, partial [Flavobacteriales bacterium]|nr:bifunctional ornithine acetyltransferase/N-acetylglutamate synthase [Flavobacteriales bacterium]